MDTLLVAGLISAPGSVDKFVWSNLTFIEILKKLFPSYNSLIQVLAL